MGNFESHIPELEADTPQVESISADLEGNNEGENLVPANVEEVLLDEYSWDSEKGNQQEEYQKFQDFLKHNPDISQQCIDLISSEDPDKIADYIYQNGFIINHDTYQVFLQSFGISLDQEKVVEEQEQVSEEEEQVSEEEEQVSEEEEQAMDVQEQTIEVTGIEKFKNLFDGIDVGSLDISSLDRLLSATENTDTSEERKDALKEIESFFENLEDDAASFDKIAKSFDTQGDAEYQEYREYAISQNVGLESQFIRYEASRGINSPAPESQLHRAQIAAGLNNNPLAAEKYGQFMEIQEGSNITVMNIGVEPPSREVGISGSPMRLERNVPVGDFYDTVSQQGLDYERFSAENDDTINAIATIDDNREAIIANLESDITIEGAEEIGFADIGGVETQDIDDVKRDIESQLGLPDGITLDSLASMLGKSLNSRNDIKNFIESTDIAGLLGKLKDEKESKRLAYQKALRDKSFTVSQSLESGDAIARDMIQNFHALGLDELWGDLELILNDPKIIASLQDQIPGFSGEHIDLANGKFGQSGNQEDTTAVLRQNITMFANLIYFGDTQPEQVLQTQSGMSVDTFGIGQFSKYERGQMISQDAAVSTLAESTGIISGGAINIGVLRQRLARTKT